MNLGALSLGMLLLAFASVPLYRLFCQVTGYGGTTKRAVAMKMHQPVDRFITVNFNADIDPHLNWEFKPGEHSVRIRIGEQALSHYVARNRSSQTITGRAVYNVVPFAAGAYFNKIECFCFTEQTLSAGKKVNMPLSFFIDPAILNDPETKDITTITLSYTFFPLKTGNP